MRIFTRKRRRSSLYIGGGLIALLAVVWITGLVRYAAALPKEVADLERGTDAIVVLTGGSERLTQGLDLLTEEKARKLFISGVYRGVDITELFRVRQQSPEEFSCCVTLGHEADNTRGNAVETAAWMEQQGFRSLRLVTASYHMPRSLLEFRHAMPDVVIVPHPVFPQTFKQEDWWRWPGSAYLLISEYSKYMIAVARTWFRAPGT